MLCDFISRWIKAQWRGKPYGKCNAMSWSRSPATSTPDGILGLRLGPSARTVVLNKWTHVRDLFDSREKGAIYADRPTNPIADYVLSNQDLHLAFAQYGPKWRKARKTVVEFLSGKHLEKILDVQNAESTQMIWELLQFCGSDKEAESKKYHTYVKRAFGAVILETVYGLRCKDSDDDSRVMRFFAIVDDFAGLLAPGATPPFDIFPWLRFVPDFLTPWKGWQKRANSVRKRQSMFYRELFFEAETMHKAGKLEESFVASLINDNMAAIRSGREKDLYTQLELDYICGFLLDAGADTTVMAFETFILAMATHPEIQKQAQEEVDAVFGSDRMPHAIDGRKSPFLKACFLETLRWRPPFPIAVPHANTVDDVYQGCSIPKGTTVISNIWAICQDTDEFDDPDSYQPSRYLADAFGIKTDGAAKEPSEKDPSYLDTPSVEADETRASGRRQTYAFGAGRRICAGSKMAENSMMMSMSKLLWSFNVLPGTDKKLDTDYGTAYKNALLTGPEPFPVKFVLRDEKKRDIITKEWEEANQSLSEFE
ncbi:hypothetical protein N0V93_000703 [Gnomoniopsis smithogilvyi]|uniref:Cytochrome P450 n=1 Tax=Gnomoniopsis smithogilvyi TaxID=1191159 RepID=A0A9W9D1L4_9PEZI|nr:hypothetical protein N0V93_000703 [Gnomoniopsis smithogilvyi]